MIGRAFSAGIAELHLHNPRDFATDRYRKVDDEPYGGGAGMVLKPEPVFAAVESVPRTTRARVLLMSPQGRPLQQADLQRWASEHDQLLLLCGHYEGFDERIRSLADEEVSAGDFVLTGGELPAMTVINGVVRLLPGTVGTAHSLVEESHSTRCWSIRTTPGQRSSSCWSPMSCAAETMPRLRHGASSSANNEPVSVVRISTHAGEWPLTAVTRPCRSGLATATTSTGWWPVGR